MLTGNPNNYADEMAMRAGIKPGPAIPSSAGEYDGPWKVGACLEYLTAHQVEFRVATDGRSWLNVDGVCRFRAQRADELLIVDTRKWSRDARHRGQLVAVSLNSGALGLLVGSKLGGLLAWSWVWVLAPVWIPLAVVGLVVALGSMQRRAFGSALDSVLAEAEAANDAAEAALADDGTGTGGGSLLDDDGGDDASE